MQAQPTTHWPALTCRTRVHDLYAWRDYTRQSKTVRVAAALFALPVVVCIPFSFRFHAVLQTTAGVAVVLFLASFAYTKWAAEALENFAKGALSDNPDPELFFTKALPFKPLCGGAKRDYGKHLVDVKTLVPDGSITHLRICSADLQDAHMEALGKAFPKVEVVDFSDCAQLTDQGLQAFLQGRRELRSIALRNCPGITQQSIRVLRINCWDLRRLDITGCQNIHWPFPLPFLSLQVLQIEKCPHLAVSGVLHWAASHPHLTTFYWDQNFPEDALRIFYGAGPLLKKLHAGFSLPGLPELHKNLLKFKSQIPDDPLGFEGSYALKTFRDTSNRVWTVKELASLQKSCRDLTSFEATFSEKQEEANAALKQLADGGSHLIKLHLRGNFSEKGLEHLARLPKRTEVTHLSLTSQNVKEAWLPEIKRIFAQLTQVTLNGRIIPLKPVIAH
jgi:hypothetical protein